LRRLKADVCCASAEEEAKGDAPQPGELPNKTDVVLWLNLTQAQQELYNLYLGSDLMRNINHSKCGMEALRGIGLLKKLCNHPLLCLSQEEFNQWRSETITPGGGPAASSSQAPAPETQEEDSFTQTQPAPECQQALPRLRALVPNSVQGAALLSCKLRVLSVLLPQLQKRGHRCLIFSQSTRMLDLIQACVLRLLGLKFLRIDGTIEAKDRDLKLQKFHAPESRYFCICLSCQVGGTGLTITGADRVILVDPAWNPSMDAQAIDRVHRIGQDKDVVVYRLIGAGAIEDKMFRLQIYKRGLTKTYLEQEQQVRFFSQKELKTLFEPPNQSTSTQSLMAAQIGPDALEHEELLNVVACDIGSTDDPQALPFWQSSDVLGFSDYSRLFSFLEQAKKEEDEKENGALVHAKRKVDILKNEEYVKDQVVENKFRKFYRDESKENMSPQKAECSVADVAPLEDVQR
jgi:SNF2 family DNA or RNA helicase